MIYRTNLKNNDKLSQLAYGCMRFPKDDKEVEKQIVYAIEHGVNYFDTAYIYPNSEERLGRVLSKGYRKRVFVATKMPTYFIRKYSDFERIFSTSIKRLQTDYIDYYLLHMLANVSEWERVCELGFLNWISEKQKCGQIRNLGFSYHGGIAEFKKLIDTYDWDFCMLQFNYLDEHNQAGKTGVEYAALKGLPVMIMEPLRGGKLANQLPKEVVDLWKTASNKRSSAEWALRWVFNHPAVATVLSGMNSIEMIKENIRIASEAQTNELTECELNLYEQATRMIMEKSAIPCTGCNYCMPCPQGVEIPMCFSCYNDKKMGTEKWLRIKYNYIVRINNHQASLCIKCGKCKKHCPQNINIQQELGTISKEMEGATYRLFRFLAKKIFHLS